MNNGPSVFFNFDVAYFYNGACKILIYNIHVFHFETFIHEKVSGAFALKQYTSSFISLKFKSSKC